MVLKLTEYVRNVISFFVNHRPGEIPIFEIFLAKILILAYVYWQSVILRFNHDNNDVIVMAYVRRLYLFWYVWKE